MRRIRAYCRIYVDKSARLTRFITGIFALLVLLPPFFAASDILDPRGNFRLVLFFALYLGEWWIAALIHELGHAFAAYLTGRRVHAIAVMPIVYRVKEQKFTWLPRGGTADIGGFVLATPEPGGDWRGGEAIFALGGILANTTSSAILFVILGGRLLGRGPYPFVGTFAALSLVVAVVNLVPIWGPRLLRSDGAMLIDAVRRRGNRGRDQLTQLVAMHYDGVPAAKWDPALVEQIEFGAQHDRKLQEATAALLYLHYLARGDLVRARALLALVASPYPDAPAWTKIGEAFFLAYLDRNGAEAQKILDKLRPAARKDVSYWRALAVTRDCMGDHDGVRVAVAKTREIAAKRKIILDSDDLALLSALERKSRSLEEAG